LKTDQQVSVGLPHTKAAVQLPESKLDHYHLRAMPTTADRPETSIS
jgi:hypothetical protein